MPQLALQGAEAPVLIVLGQGIVPRVSGWLDALLAALGTDEVPERDAGMALAGLPLAGDGGPLPSLRVAAAMRTDAVESVGGLPADWLDAEHRDADLALRLLAAGFRARMLPAPACVRCASPDARWDAPAAKLAAALDTRRLAARAASHRRAACEPGDHANGGAQLAIAI